MELGEEWRVPLGHMPFVAADVEVWLARLATASENEPAMADILAEDERARASTLVFAPDRSKFILRHAFLRSILGYYLGLAPPAVRFERSPRGKPFLAGRELDFSMAHSGEIALYAVSRGGALGVDVEQVEHIADDLDVAERLFTGQERDAILRLPRERQVNAFFTCWTRKEAVLKAMGDGLRRQPKSFEIWPGAERTVVRMALDGAPGTVDSWTVADLPTIPGYAAALAIRGELAGFSTWRAIDPAGML